MASKTPVLPAVGHAGKLIGSMSLASSRAMVHMGTAQGLDGIAF